jgi:glycosyltransferase involved in cell wall biosynthesis
MMNLLKGLIIIPCYNEEEAIGKLLTEMMLLSLPPQIAIDILVVNDCSKDNTSSKAKENGARIIDLPINLGIGGAMQTGFIYAQKHHYDFAVQMDGDGQHPPSELIKLIDQFTLTHSNIVIGSRFVIKQGFQSSTLRRIGISYFHYLTYLFTRKSIYDITSGFRLFDQQALQIIASKYPDDYPEPESLIIFSRAGLSLEEVPVVMRERQGGKSSIRNFSQLYYMAKVTIAMFFSNIRK